ncbi:MAG TPA: D-sedoheptulose 7-phosphate isomerase [Geobacteraceae bacterium]
MHDAITAQLQGHTRVMTAIEGELVGRIAAVVELLVTALREGRKLLIMGNGGSAADAQHFAAEIVGRFRMERRALPAVALTTDTSILTAVGNDYGFDLIFRRQVEALAAAGDVVIGISTSGNSTNVRNALLAAAERDCRTVGLLGGDGGSIREIVELDLTVPSRETPRIQEGHVTIIHILCDLVEQRLFAREV